jgi:hypothetical protein
MKTILLAVLTLLVIMSFTGGAVGTGLRAAAGGIWAALNRIGQPDDDEDPEPLPQRHAAVDLTDEDRRSDDRYGDYIDPPEEPGEEFTPPPTRVSSDVLARYEGFNLDEHTRRKKPAPAQPSRKRRPAPKMEPKPGDRRP